MGHLRRPAADGGRGLASPRASDRVCRLYVAAFWGWQALRLRRGAARTDLKQRVATMEQFAETEQLPTGTPASRSDNIVFFNDNAHRALRLTVTAPNAHWRTGWEEAVHIQPPLLREVFGNPLRPVLAEPMWLTSDVVALAKGIYEDKAFDRMPILADALQDAGCANEDVLNHCRDAAQVHVRGCWVLDLTLREA